MKKTLTSLVLSILLLFSSTSIMALEDFKDVGGSQEVSNQVQEPVIFQETIKVSEDGGSFQVGFVNVEFKKDFLETSLLPATFYAKIYAENGQVFIEFSPDSPLFYKQVHLKIDSYSGYLYDIAQGENIYVDVKKQQVLAPHFSRYCIFD